MDGVVVHVEGCLDVLHQLKHISDVLCGVWDLEVDVALVVVEHLGEEVRSQTSFFFQNVLLICRILICWTDP